MHRNLSSAARIYKAVDSWMDASTVILTTPQLPKDKKDNKLNSDFDVMMLKRSEKSSFYANAYVFPGGKIDKADCSSQWLNLYNTVDKSFVKHFQRLEIEQKDEDRSPMFHAHPDDVLLRELSFRICAIRETFEETGILLARMKVDELSCGANVRFAESYEFKDICEIDMWRRRVHEDAYKFIDLCLHLRCVPDVWALHEWVNWLTPSEMFSKQSKRYDTVFYKAALLHFPKHFQEDNKEITHIIFNSANDLLSAYYSKKINLGPPQVYELCRILQFSSHHELAKFTSERASLGMERWLPVNGSTTDGTFLTLFPGDYYYPAAAVAEGDSAFIHIPVSYDDILKDHPHQLHHMKFDTTSKLFHLVASQTPVHGHILPISYQANTPNKM